MDSSSSHNDNSGFLPPELRKKLHPVTIDRILRISHSIAELSVKRGRLQARLRPITNELANLRRELEKLLKEAD